MIKGRGDHGARANADEAIRPYYSAVLRLAHDDTDMRLLEPAASPNPVIGAHA